jgi:hypothetical protein
MNMGRDGYNMGRDGYNMGRDGYNMGRDGYNDAEAMQGRSGYNEEVQRTDSPVPLNGHASTYNRKPLSSFPLMPVERNESPNSGMGGRSGYNKEDGGMGGRSGYNKEDGGMGGRSGYNKDDIGMGGRSGYNENSGEQTSCPGTPSQQPIQSPRPARRGTSPAPIARRATLSPMPGQNPRIRVTHGTSNASLSGLSDLSDDSLSWDSELDGPDSSDSESEDSIPHHRKNSFYFPRRGLPQDDEQSELEDEFAADPWNAVCVVGLRVYSKDTEVSIEVVRPDHQKLTDEERKQKALDIDDSARDATRRFSDKRADEKNKMRRVGTAPAGLEWSKQGAY